MAVAGRQPRKTSPSTPPPTPHPRNSSPCKRKKPILGCFERAGRTFSHSHPPPDHAGRTFSRTGRTEVVTVKPTTPLQPLMQTSVKPPSPMLAREQHPLKPATPMQAKNAPKTPNSHPQRRYRFQMRLSLCPQRRWRFQTTGPHRHAGRRRDRRARASCKTWGLAAVPVGGGTQPDFETTHPGTHQRPSPTGVEGAGGPGGHGRAAKRGAWPRCRWAVAGPGCGARGRRRGLAGLRDDAPSEARGADGSRAGRRPRAHKAARPHRDQAAHTSGDSCQKPRISQHSTSRRRGRPRR